MNVATAAIVAFGVSHVLIQDAQFPTVPDYDVDKYCTLVASSIGPRSEMIYGGCFDQEQLSYDSLKRIWSNVPVQTRRYCDNVAQFGGGGSYMILRGCIDMEENAATQNQRRQFRR